MLLTLIFRCINESKNIEVKHFWIFVAYLCKLVLFLNEKVNVPKFLNENNTAKITTCLFPHTSLMMRWSISKVSLVKGNFKFRSKENHRIFCHVNLLRLCSFIISVCIRNFKISKHFKDHIIWKYESATFKTFISFISNYLRFKLT